LSEPNGTWNDADKPEIKFGGTWELIHNTEGVFFRTEGSIFESSRLINGLQKQDWKGQYWSSFNQGYQHPEYFMGKDMVTPQGNVFSGYWSAPGNVLKVRWQTDSEAEIRPNNRLMRIWLRKG